MAMLLTRLTPLSSPWLCPLTLSLSSRSHTGYIPFEGRFRCKPSALTRLNAASRQLTLEAVKRIRFSFDPFRSDSQAIREVIFKMSLERVKRTNRNCVQRYDVLSNGEAPQMRVELVDEAKHKDLLFHTQDLDATDIVTVFNEIVLPITAEVKALRESKMGKQTKTSKKAKKK